MPETPRCGEISRPHSFRSLHPRAFDRCVRCGVAYGWTYGDAVSFRVPRRGSRRGIA